VAVTYSVGLSSAAGVPSGRRQDEFPTSVHLPVPTLWLQGHRGKAYRSTALGLQLTGGTKYDGTWTGTMNVTVADAGSMVPLDVHFDVNDDPGATNYSTIPPQLQRPVTVTASHVPVVTVTPFPAHIRYGSAYVVSGRVRELASGAPMARVTVHVGGTDSSEHVLITDAAGRWRVRVSHLRGFVSVSILPPAYSDGQRPPIAKRDVQLAMTNVVWASLTHASAHVGDSITITGSDGPVIDSPDQMVLEKWVHHTWAIVGGGALRLTGRFTLHALPSAPGNWEYRVRDRSRGGVSAVLTLHVVA
jgi:hypothetical protein